MNEDEVKAYIDEIPDEVFQGMTFSVPWNPSTIDSVPKDADGFPIAGSESDTMAMNFAKYQKACWDKFMANPQVNSYIRDYMGRLTGFGFEMGSDVEEIDAVVKNVVTDMRNRLYTFLPKYVARSEVEGELFLVLTLHKDGFVEVDFRDPGTVVGQQNPSGIIYHPTKPNMPLVYCFEYIDSTSQMTVREQIPSIFIAMYPSLLEVAKKNPDFRVGELKKGSHSRSRVYNSTKGYFRFVIQWDKGFITSRNLSHLRTTLTWINHYENLKKYEIDHKKSSGSYLWVFKITDAKAYKQWLTMSDTDRKNTGIMAKKTPGSSIVLPPGIEIECKNPQLPKISDADTDILEMVVSGLNIPSDMSTGTTKGSTFSGIKASRGPMSDRMKNEEEYFRRFLIFDFWRPIFFLMQKMGKLNETYTTRKAVRFENRKPVMENVQLEPHELLEISFPISDITDQESTAKAMLGVKHGSVKGTLGIPRRMVARRLGFGSYKSMLLESATEDEVYPELEVEVDQESQQEQNETGEGKKNRPKEAQK